MQSAQSMMLVSAPTPSAKRPAVLPTCTIRSPWMTTSPEIGEAPVPSTMVPPVRMVLVACFMRAPQSGDTNLLSTQQVQNLLIEKIDMRLVLRIDGQRGIANRRICEDTACHEQCFLYMMEEFKALQTVDNLRQDTLEQLIGRVFIPGTRPLPNDLKKVRDCQSRHHSANACIDELYHEGAAPSVDHADSPIGLFDD